MGESNTHIDRMKVEEAELAEKTEKLGAFLSTDTYKGLSSDAKLLMHEQHVAMTSYLSILRQRIELGE